MDFFFVEYRDPIVGLVVLTALVLVVALAHYFWRVFATKSQEKGLEGFIKKFEIMDEHKDLLRASSLSLENLHFLASIFTKSGEFEKAIQIYLIALEKVRDKDEQELIFYDLAEVYFKAGFLQRSVEVLLNALNLRPRNEKALKLLKIVYLRLKRYDEVLQTLDCLFELGFDISTERAFVEILRAKNLSQHSQSQIQPKNSPESANDNQNSSQNKAKIQRQSEPNLSKNNDFVKRFLFENGVEAHAEFALVIDLLYKSKKPVFLEDSEYFELFCAMNLTPKKQNYTFKNPKIQMLAILNESDFKAKLNFSYVCTHCKNQMPLFFYHCPICYEFGGCKILYEVRDDESR